MSDISRAEIASIARREAKKQFEQLSEQQEETEPSDEDVEADQLAETVMTAQDWRVASEEDKSNREYLMDYKGVDPADCDSEAELRRKIGMMD